MKELFNLFVGLLLFTSLVIGTNFIVDPYHFFGDPLYYVENGLKPNSAQQKSIVARNVLDKDVFIFGTSRTERGIDPSAKIFRELELDAYNFGISGLGVYDLSRVLDYFTDKISGKEVVIGLDYFSFEKSNSMRADIRESMFNPENGFTFFALSHLASLSTLSYSLKSLRKHSEGSIDVGLHTGFYGVKETEDYNYRFAYKKTLSNYMSNGYGALCPYMQTELFENVLVELLNNGNNVSLFISPVHALMRGAMNELGHQSTFDAWKKQLAHIVNVINSASVDGRISLWDFSLISSVTLEDSDGMNNWGMNYWEPSHYKPHVGELIIKKLFGLFPTPNFGVQLTVENVSSVIDEDEENFQRLQQSEDFELFLKQVYFDTLKERFHKRKYKICISEERDDFIVFTPELVNIGDPSAMQYVDLVSGWYSREGWGVWSNGPVSKVRMRLPVLQTPEILELNGRTYQERPTTVLINGVEVATNVQLHPKKPFKVMLNGLDLTGDDIIVEFHQEIKGDSLIKVENIAVGLTAIRLK